MSTTIDSLELQIKSNSASATKGIDALTQSLEKLKNATKGGLGLSSVSSELSSISSSSKEASSSMKEVSDSANKSSASFTDFFHAISVGVRAFKMVGSSIKSLIDKSSEYNEVVNLFSISMGKYADEAYDYADKVSRILGIDPKDWMKNQGVFMTLATGFGVAGDRAYKMSEQLTQLGYDISSFQDISVEEAMQKLQSGLAGELEPLRRIGYDLSQAKLEATALELGIDKSVSSMTQAEKAQLRYYAIMTQVTSQHGDLARTLDEPANQMRVFQSQLEQTARSIGNIFIPALQAILPYGIAVAQVIREAADSIASLVGYEEPEFKSTETIADIASTASDELDEAGDEAKKLKSYMLGFDELNVINPNSGTEDTSDMFDFDLPTYDFLGERTSSKVDGIVTKIKDVLGELKDVINSLGFEPIINRLKELFDVLKGQFEGLDFKTPIFETIEGYLASHLDFINLIVQSLAPIIEDINLPEILLGALELGAESLKTISKILRSLTPAAKAFVKAMSPVFKWIGSATSTGLKELKNLLGEIGDWFEQLAPEFEEFSKTLGERSSEIILVALELGVELLKTSITIVKALVSSVLALGEAFSPITESIFNGVFDKGTESLEFLTNVAKDLRDLLEELALKFESIGTSIGEITVKVWDFLEPLASEMWEGFHTVLDSITDVLFTLIEDLTILSEDIIGDVNEGFDGLCKALEPVRDLLGNVLLTIFEKVSEWLDYVSTNILPTLTTTISNLWNNVLVPLGQFLITIFEPAIRIISDLLGYLWQYVIVPLADAIWELLCDAFDRVSMILNEKVIPKVKMIITVCEFLWNNVLAPIVNFLWDIFAPAFEEVFKGIANVIDGIKKLFSGVTDFFLGVFTKDWELVWDGIVKIFMGAFEIASTRVITPLNFIIAKFEAFVNKIIDGWNLLKSVINSLSLDIPEWLGGGTLGFNLAMSEHISVPRIPLLASGAYDIPQGQLFVAREAGAEMVGSIGRKTAVANNDQIVGGIASGVAEANTEQNALLREQNSLLRAILEKDSGVYLDGKSLANSVEKYQRERGRQLVTGGVM